MASEEEKIKHGFNVGYVMEKHEPTLLNEILKTDNQENEYIQAISKGQRQQKKERLIEQQKQQVQKQSLKPKR